jgi:hypothetical protein
MALKVPNRIPVMCGSFKPYRVFSSVSLRLSALNISVLKLLPAFLINPEYSLNLKAWTAICVRKFIRSAVILKIVSHEAYSFISISPLLKRNSSLTGLV